MMNAYQKPRTFVHLIVLLILLLVGLAEAQASHFRFGHLTWQPRPDISPTTVDFTFMGAWRRSAYSGTAPDGRPKIGDIVGDSSISFGDGSSSGTLYFEVTAISVEQDWVIGIARQAQGPIGVIRKKYATPRHSSGAAWVASANGCCRISTLRNGADASYNVQSSVDLTIPNTPPISNLPPIVSCPRGKPCVFAVPAVDANGDTIRWRFTPSSQSSIPSLPGGTSPGQPITIDPSTGIVSWNTVASAPLGLYALSVTMEDLASGGAVKSSSTIDFLLNLQNVADNAAPVFDVPPTPASNSNVTALVGQPLAIDVRASDSNVTDLVTLNHVGLPQGAKFTSIRGNPAVGIFEWTPSAADVGDRIVTFTAIDSRSAAALPHPLIIKVVNPPLRNIKVIATVANNNIDVRNASFARAPSKIEALTEHTVIEWKFPGFNVGETANLDFEVLLKNPSGGEKRLVTESVELSYEDLNGVQVRRTLPSQYVDVLPSIYQVGVSTNQPVYGPNQVAAITVPIKNLSEYSSNTTARVSVRDAAGVQVSEVAITPVTALEGGESRLLSGFVFQTGSTYIGNYQAVAELLDAQGRIVAQASTPFQIVSSLQVAADAKIVTDKQVYLPSDVVKVVDRISNVTANALLNDLRVITTVKNPNGTARFTRTEVLPQLAQGNLKDYGYSVPLAFAPAGAYSAVLVVTTADGTVLAQSNATFTVSSTADSGSGLTGTIAASPKEVPLGDAVAISFGATNAGNNALADLPLKVSIVDPQAQTVVAEFPYLQSLIAGTSYSAATSWQSTGTIGNTYVAVLTATIGGKTLTLAQDSFLLIAPPVKLDLAHTLAQGSRVLVLVSCKDGTVITPATGAAPCVTDRSHAIVHTLTELGISHTITTTPDTFKAALRSGIYNTYWISGKEDKLHDALSSEVREAVFGGDGFISDSQHDERNKVLDQAAGITWRGKLGHTGLDVDLAGPLFAPQRLATVERALRLVPNGSTVQGTLSSGNADAAIVSHAYGAGRAVTFAFDLVQSLQAQPQWKAILATGLEHVMPDNRATVTPGALLSVNTNVANLARAVDVTVKSTLPQGAAYLGSSPTGNYDAGANSIDWAFHLPESQSKDLLLTMRAPQTAGDSTLQTIVSTTRNGTTTAYGAPLALSINVTPAATTAAHATQKLTALLLTQSKDQKLRDSLVADLQQVMGLFSQNTAAGYEAAIAQLVRIIDALTELPVDTTAVRLDLDRILKEAQWRWTKTQPAQ
jgi:hypothetical protein